ncbi:MAG: SUMF1/EgtB/PvdO family nonheme iron enzyme [Bacteroidaceae bacterium]|nr:SUMF1/EgtB/PvdO family nonheme iron enzyme [Bacteroidaceae bacterium]
MRTYIALFACLLALTTTQAQDVVIRRNTTTTTTTTSTTTVSGKPQDRVVNRPTKPTMGTLSITSTPSDAAIKIDGEYMGTTPLTLKNRKAGTYRITFSAEGYETTTQSVTVTAGKMATCSATLKKKQAQQPAQQPTPSTTPSTSSASSQTFTANGVSFKMIRVEGGTFTMGATSEQGSDADSDEKPAHQVTLSSYYIGETEVTQALWQAVMGSTVSQQRDKANKEWPLRGVGTNYPMYYISWDECQEFVRKLNSLTGQSFRLPTEAQWEFAARGGNKSQGYKYSGSNTLGNVAWYTDNSGSETHPVKTKSPNELGIYDMSGNVWEWCQDWYGSYSSSSQTNPTGASSGSNRVRRGGGWSNLAGDCRVSYRLISTPGNRGGNLGLRLAL